jgi:hypothetical protein
MLPALTEHGFLPVPPVVHVMRMEDLPGCFGVKGHRKELWVAFTCFVDHLKRNTEIQELFLDGRFISASEDVKEIEVGIELPVHLVRGTNLLQMLKFPAREEFYVRVRYFSPTRPDRFNFHEEFQTPDPEIRLRDATPDLRKGYLKILL